MPQLIVISVLSFVFALAPMGLIAQSLEGLSRGDEENRKIEGSNSGRSGGSLEELEAIVAELKSAIRSDIQSRFRDQIDNQFARQAFDAAVEKVIETKLEGDRGIRGWIARQGEEQSGNDVPWSDCLANVPSLKGLQVMLAADHQLSQIEYCRDFPLSLEDYFRDRPRLRESFLTKRTIIQAQRRGRIYFADNQLHLPTRFRFDELDHSLSTPPKGVALCSSRMWFVSDEKLNVGKGRVHCAERSFDGTTNWRQAGVTDMTPDIASCLLEQHSPFATLLRNTSVRLTPLKDAWNSLYNATDASISSIPPGQNERVLCVGKKIEFANSNRLLIKAGPLAAEFELFDQPMPYDAGFKLCAAMSGNLGPVYSSDYFPGLLAWAPALLRSRIWGGSARESTLLNGNGGSNAPANAEEQHLVLCSSNYYTAY